MTPMLDLLAMLPEPLYDVNIPTPTHAERARTLVDQVQNRHPLHRGDRTVWVSVWFVL